MASSRTYPGVSLSVIDQSAYTSGIANDTKIGIFADTLKGPAGRWVRVSSFGEYTEVFGGLPTVALGDNSTLYYGPLAAKTILAETDELYVYRLLGDSGASHAVTGGSHPQPTIEPSTSIGITFRLLSSGATSSYGVQPRNAGPTVFIEASNVNRGDSGAGPALYDLYVYESDQYWYGGSGYDTEKSPSNLTFNGYQIWGSEASNLKATEVYKKVAFLREPSTGTSVLNAIGNSSLGQVSTILSVEITNNDNWNTWNNAYLTKFGALGEAADPSDYGSIFLKKGATGDDMSTGAESRAFFKGADVGDGARFGNEARDLNSVDTDASSPTGLIPKLDIVLMPDAHLSTAYATAQDSLIDVAEAYGAIAPMSAPQSSTVVAATDWAIARNSSYAAGYAPWLTVYHNSAEGYIQQPADAWAARAYLYTDRVNWPWYAPAGAKRGALGDVAPWLSYSEADQETLYDDNVNVIRNLHGFGPVIWGQKTTQQSTTALDRVNVRRLMNYLQHKIEGYAENFLFEPNDASTWGKLASLCTGLLEGVKAERGVYDYLVIIDETTNTQTMIDNNTLAGKIFIKPTKSAEVIALSFTITGSGASFTS